jgi:pyruvate/2-oxoglutarate dehydrogenase complex dihydrolipoamide acyltransferase (E2) component
MHEREFSGGAEPSALPGGAGSEREAAAPLDGRQIFFLFIGSALCACLIFAAGVVCGRRVERRAVAAAQTTAVTDPLAVLDEIANAEEALTFHRALLDRPAGRPRAGEAGAEPDPAAGSRKPMGPPKPRFTLQGPLVAKNPEAEALIRRLREAGYRPTLVEIATAHKPAQYRVQVGDFPSPEIAQSLKSELLTRYQLRATIAPF